jgi:outer membrane protein assembly factor BamB
MSRSALLLPLLITHGACEWFTSPPQREGVWLQAHSGYSYAKPVLLGDTVFVATGDGKLIARNASTGAALWTASVGSGRIWGGNLVVAAGAVVAPVLFETRAVDTHTGAPLWTYKAPLDTVDVGSGPRNPGTVAKVRIAASDSTVFIPAWGGTVAAVHARTGALRWRWTPPALPHRFGAQGAIFAGGTSNTVYVSVWHFLDGFGNVSEGRVVALDASTGAERWHAVLPTRENVVMLSGAPAIVGNVVVVTTLNGRTYALNRSTGALAWSLPPDTPAPGDFFTSVLTGAVSSGDTLYADAGTHHIRAISSTGNVLWSAPYEGQLSMELTVSDSRLYGPDGGFLYIFDKRTGRLVKRVSPPGPSSGALFPASVAVSSTLVFAPVNGAVWAINP